MKTWRDAASLKIPIEGDAAPNPSRGLDKGIVADEKSVGPGVPEEMAEVKAATEANAVVMTVVTTEGKGAEVTNATDAAAIAAKPA